MARIPLKAWLLVTLSAILQVIIFPPIGAGILSWVALAPLFWALLQQPRVQILKSEDDEAGFRPRQGFVLGYLCGVLWYAGTCAWIYHTVHVYGHMDAPVAVGVLMLFCLYLGLYHGIFGALLVVIGRRSGVRTALWVAPFLWVALELARYHITGCPWDLLGTVTVNNVGLSRLATITGVYGLSFVLAAANAVLANAVIRHSAKVAVLGAVIIVAAHVLHFYRPAPSLTTHRATLVQHNLPIDVPGGWTPLYFDQTMGE